MSGFIQSLFKSFSEVPKDKFPAEFYTPFYVRGYIFGNYAYPSGLLAHIIFLIVFSLLGVTPLAYFNIFSVILWASVIVIHRKGYLWLAYYLITIEIIAHAAICAIVIGWAAGFQYYVLVQPSVVFLLPGTLPRKTVIAAIYTFAFVTINYFANLTVPLIKLSTPYLDLINYGNVISVCALLAYLAYIYYRATITAEETLKKEHDKANAALKERNRALERLNRELAEAADYVKTILPAPVTEGAIRTDWRFVPSASLGGDAFGYHWVDDDHFAIYLIDVSGHGVGAALLSVSVMNVLRSQSLTKTDFKAPEQVLESLNHAFPGEDNNDMFFTIWYGVYNKRTKVLTYASGGHPPALLLDNSSGNGSTINALRTPNNVIGGVARSTYEKKECTIYAHSKLYIFSDGVYEVEKSDGSMWRFQEFSDFMTRIETENQSKLDHLYDHARKLGQQENLEDDFTILEVAFV